LSENNLFGLLRDTINPSFGYKPVFSLRQAFTILWIKERPLPIHGSAFSFSQSYVIPSGRSFVHHNSIIPECYSARCPLPANGEIVSIEEMLPEEGKDVTRFLAVEFLNAFNESRVIIQGLDAGNRMGSDL
jgi:hypothetical protein